VREHVAFTTAEGYAREAENLGASFGEVFPALPSGIAPGDSEGPIARENKGGRGGRNRD
jgi:hypothetical protein